MRAGVYIRTCAYMTMCAYVCRHMYARYIPEDAIDKLDHEEIDMCGKNMAIILHCMHILLLFLLCCIHVCMSAKPQ